MSVISSPFAVLLSACIPAVLGLQTRLDQGTTLSTQGLPRIGTFHVYSTTYHRPKGLSMEDAASHGLYVTAGPSAWESDHPVREFDNSGNLVWSLGARMLIGNASEMVMGSERWPKDDSLSAILIATGPVIDGGMGRSLNEIKGATHFYPRIIDAFRTVEKPTFIVGMGIGDYDGQKEFKCMDTMDEEKKNAMDKVQERIKKLGGIVGLRGKCSESVMRRYGYSGFEALGCPSLFINTSPNLGNILETKFKALLSQKASSFADLKVAVALPTLYDERVVPFLVKIAQFFPKSILVHQHPSGDTVFNNTCKDLGIEKPAKQSVMYYDALEWRQALSKMDLVVSGRIHGAMIGIAAQTPTVVIPIDMRVLEMVEAMKVPHIMPADLPHNVRDFVVKAVSKFDGQAFDKQRSAYAARYRELFNNVGLTLNPDISRL